MFFTAQQKPPAISMDGQLLIALCFLTILLEFSIAAADTLSADQTLADGQVLNSPNQIFEVGFFSPPNSTNRFLGIWYKPTPDVVYWVANRQDPINGAHGVLTLSQNGNLILSSNQSGIIWSSNSSTAASTPSLRLLNTGNLVVVDDSQSPERYLWQSFDNPGDSCVPDMRLVQGLEGGEGIYLTSWKSADDPSVGEFSYRIENKGLSQLVVKKGANMIYRSVFWNGHVTGYPVINNVAWGIKTLTDRGRLISAYMPYSYSFISRTVINKSGLLERYIMNEQRNGWGLVLAVPRDSCDQYGFCGPNGICKIYKTPVCDCLWGFKPRSEQEWGVFNWSRGCARNLSLDCWKEDGFKKVEGIKLPDSLSFRLNSGISFGECHDECLRNCNCTAYADPYFKNESSCMMWFGDLIDLREFTEDISSKPILYVRVPLAELGNFTDGNKKKGTSQTKIKLIAAFSAIGMLILSFFLAGVFLRARLRRLAYKKTKEELELPIYDLATIAAATNNFSGENMIGEGGFGPVYKGNLSGGRVVAVKRMSRTSGQGSGEFKNEVILMAKLQHRNLVRILGCCIEAEEKMLIYEYMHNKSLDYFIFDENRSALLTWPMRFNIIMGIARGLLYLHHDSRLKIIHRDLKASNILLDENLNARISDFGLARMFEGDQTTARTKRVVGTYGYMAPEYVFDGNFSIKSDVFSMGVVILEIVSGKKNRGFKHNYGYQNLLELTWLLWKENRELDLMDPCYEDSYVESQVKRCIQVGLLCVQNVAEERPEMSSVILMLSSENGELIQPKKPGFFLESSTSSSEKNTTGTESSGIGAMTMSISAIQGR